ncbi:MAG TPA: hypothetical protein VN669_02715 [Candidatus Acidoferrales bacterium]|jgi:hypothetical protein|nr:hypothetical protein [Candidatus Acidoferrales bacterium]
MLSDDEVDHGNTCEPEPQLSVHEVEEIVLIKRMMALPDRRPDPGIYRNADSDGEALDLVELDAIYSWPDPRPFTTPWRPYIAPEDLLEDSAEQEA